MSTLKKKASETPMVPKARDPFSLMREEMNDLMARIWGGEGNPSGLTMNPALDVSEEENAYEITVDAPGVKADDFDIQVQGNSVTIRGNRSEMTEEKEKTFHRVERRSGSFSRTITLPCDINEEEVAAQYENGVLTVTLPKAEESKAKRISVRT